MLEALLVEEGLREGFEPHDVPEPTLEGRTDLRDLTTFTVDPDTAKDFDDAISVRREGDGVRIWVHIADVSYFVPAGSPLDRGAYERGNSVYVPGLVAPMLPHELADDACSLRPHQDRLCVTVEIAPGGEPSFYRSVIRSRERFTYGQAQRILEGGEQHELADDVRLADSVSADLRRRRFARGALRVESPEVNFAFDGQGGVERAWLEAEPDGARADRGADDPRERGGGRVPRRPQGPSPCTASTSRRSRSPSSTCSRSWPTSRSRRRLLRARRA